MSNKEQLVECGILIRKAKKAKDWDQVNRLRDTQETIIEQIARHEYHEAEQAIRFEQANTLWSRLYNSLKAIFRWTKN